MFFWQYIPIIREMNQVQFPIGEVDSSLTASHAAAAAEGKEQPRSEGNFRGSEDYLWLTQN